MSDLAVDAIVPVVQEVMNAYLQLGAAIVAEVIATSFLKASENFTRLWPSVLSLSGYLVALYFLSGTLTTMPTGLAYAIWSGVGIVLISIVSWIWHKQHLDVPAILGIALITMGVVVINVFSKSVTH